MDIDKLNKWADLLLDTGKRNNLINFRDTKMSTVEVVVPDFATLFSKVEHNAAFEVYDPKLDDEDEDEIDVEESTKEDFSKDKKISKEDYVDLYEKRIKKSGQILAYNSFVNPIKAIKNIGKKAKTAVEETGVNIA